LSIYLIKNFFYILYLYLDSLFLESNEADTYVFITGKCILLYTTEISFCTGFYMAFTFNHDQRPDRSINNSRTEVLNQIEISTPKLCLRMCGYIPSRLRAGHFYLTSGKLNLQGGQQMSAIDLYQMERAAQGASRCRIAMAVVSDSNTIYCCLQSPNCEHA
jgi:hypothetical protein